MRLLYKNPTFICLLSSLFFAYELVQFHMMNAISPFLMKDLQLHATSFGNLCATYLLADVIFLLPAGIILDRFSVRKVVMAALCLCILGTIGFSMATNFGQAALCHFLSGIGNAFCLLSSLILVSRWFKSEKHPMIMGLVVTIGMLGAVVAQSPFSLLANLFTWRVALMLDAGAGVLLLGLIYLFVHDNAQAKEENTNPYSFWQGVRLSLFNRQNVLLGLYTSLTNMPLMVVGAVFGSLYLMQVHHIPLTMASFISSMISFGTIIGSTLFGYLSSKMYTMRFWMLLGAFLASGTFFLILFLPNPTAQMLTLLFFLLGLFTSTQVLSYPLIAKSNPPALTGTSLGVAAVIIMGLPMLVQPLCGMLLDLGWNGSMENGSPLYSAQNFLSSFIIFPLCFAIAIASTYLIKEMAPQREV